MLAPALLSAALTAPAGAHAAASAQAVYVKGKVESSAQGGPWQPVAANARLASGTQVRTGADGFLRLSLSDGSMLLLDPSATLTIQVIAAKEKSLATRLQLALGSLWADIVSVSGTPDFTVEAGGAVIGVRGTNFVVDAGADSAVDVSVSDGTVRVRRPGTAAPGGPPSDYDVQAGSIFAHRRTGFGMRELNDSEHARFRAAWRHDRKVHERVDRALRASAARRKKAQEHKEKREEKRPPRRHR